MTDLLQVDFAAIEAAEGRLRAAEGAVRKILAQLESTASQLRAQWTGEASDAYELAQAKWSSSADELTAILDDTVGNLTTARTRYLEAERANASRWPG